jgi:2-(1,2-epoxy-1,2-dihydrophenyl)acetyl-CoA isomerase
MNFTRIKLEFENNIAMLTFNNPTALNAVSMQMLRELKEVPDRLEDPSNNARCLLITGEGRGFCAGADLGDPERGAGEEADLGKKLRTWYNPFLLRLRELQMPIVTAVNGPAAGIGMSFALMGDIILAARSAFFLQAFRNIGLVPDGGATFILPRRVGLTKAMELSTLAERLSADKALEMGLINRVYDDGELMPRALELATSLAEGPTKGLSLIRKAYWSSLDNSYSEQLELEATLQSEAGQTEDHKEGVAAFLEKREPRFTGS